MQTEPDAFEISEALAGWAKVPAGRLPDRLALAMTHAIRSGLFPDGMRLPPERELAKTLAVSRPTVSSALELLRERRLVTSRQGSGTWIQSRQLFASSRDPIVDVVRSKGGVNFAASVPPDAAHLTGVKLDGAELLRIDPLNGYNRDGLAHLKDLVAEHHRSLGLPTSWDQILVTEGAHHGLAITIGELASNGAPVAVESHTYPGMPDIAAATGTRLVAVALEEDGLDLEHLDVVVRGGKPAALVLQPMINSPTGRPTSDDRLDDVAEFADVHELTVVENNTLADLSFTGRKPLLAERCERAEVISVETLSKTAWVGLRIGWIRASAPLCTAIGMRARRTALGTSIPSQLIAVRILEQYPDLIATRQRLLHTRARRMMTLLSSNLPDWRQTVPAGGLSLWVRLPVQDTRAFVAVAEKHGVSALAGALTTPHGTNDSHIRLCFDRPDREVVVGLERIMTAWQSYQVGVGRVGLRREP